MKRFILFFFFITNVSSAQSYLTTAGNVNFLSKAPLSEFNGVSDQLNGLVDLSQNLLDFYVDLNTLNTGIGLRDKHMRDNYLETEKYPFAEFTGKITPTPSLTTNSKQSVTAMGKFTIHGVTKEITVTGTLLKNAKGELELEAGFEVLLSDYQIPLPKLVFYELAENQVISIKATLKPKK